MSITAFLNYFPLTFLSQTQAEIPSSLHLQTSSSLGTGKASTHRERFDRLEDKEVRRALDGRAGKRKRHDDVYAVTHPDNENSDEEEDLARNQSDGEDTKHSSHKAQGQNLKVAVADPVIVFQPVTPVAAVVGSALQRNADGTIMAPKIKQKVKRKKVSYETISSPKA